MNKRLLTFLLALFLSGCGGSDGNRADVGSKSLDIAKQSSTPVVITGIIRNDKTLIKSATLEATDDGGKVVATKHIKDAPRFSLEIPAGAQFPVLITVRPDADQPKTERLKVVVVTPYATDQIITKVTTDVADKARELGGYTRENMMKAAMGTVAVPDRDKTVGGFRGDPTKQYGGWH